MFLCARKKPIVPSKTSLRNSNKSHLHLNGTPSSAKDRLESDGLGHDAGQQRGNDAGVGCLRRRRQNLSEQVRYHHAVALSEKISQSTFRQYPLDFHNSHDGHARMPLNHHRDRANHIDQVNDGPVLGDIRLLGSRPAPVKRSKQAVPSADHHLVGPEERGAPDDGLGVPEKLLGEVVEAEGDDRVVDCGEV